MNHRLKLGVLAVLCFSMAASLTSASTFTVDGALGDWGVGILTGATNVNSGNLNSYAGDPGLTTPYGASDYSGLGSGFSFAIEDTNDLSSKYYYVGPNYGGQNYDVEFLGAAIEHGNLLIAIMTGQRPDNGWNKKKGLYSPGDIRIDMQDGTTYALEAGGGGIHDPDWGGIYGFDGPAGGPMPSQINKGDPGTTYNLRSSGFTESVSILSDVGPDAQTAGSLWRIGSPVDWIYDPINPKTPTQFEGGTKVGDAAEYIYKFTAETGEVDLGQHAVIEARIPLSLFDGGALQSVTWSASGGNDFLRVDFLQGDIDAVPEPASLLVWCGLALVGLIAGPIRPAIGRTPGAR